MTPWRLENFTRWLDSWKRGTQPSAALKKCVIEEVLALRTNAYAGTIWSDFYQRVLPGCVAENGDYVSRTWTVHPEAHTVWCRSIHQGPLPHDFEILEGDEVEPEGWFKDPRTK